jgi:tubby-related protein 1
MGECPRYFKLEIHQNGEVHKMENLKPEWNDNLDCYCLNFYGRVKKASAKNFQIIYPDDPDNIIFQHGKVSKDEFNLDFREPFNYIYAFAVSLAAIGKKRVVS